MRCLEKCGRRCRDMNITTIKPFIDSNTDGSHCENMPIQITENFTTNPASILYKSIAGRYRPVSYPDGPITARYRFIKNAYWKKWKFSDKKKSDIFHTSAQNIDLVEVILTTIHNLCFWAEIRKIMYTPVNSIPYKSGIKGGRNYTDMFSWCNQISMILMMYEP